MKEEKQVGALPVLQTKNGNRVLLVTCKDKKRWIIPKGSRSKRVKDRVAAEREAIVEGGVVGTARPRPPRPFHPSLRQWNVERS